MGMPPRTTCGHRKAVLSVIAKSKDLQSSTNKHQPPLVLLSHKTIECQNWCIDIAPKSHKQVRRKGITAPTIYEFSLSTPSPPCVSNIKLPCATLQVLYGCRDEEVRGEFSDYGLKEESDVTTMNYALENVCDPHCNVVHVTDY